MSRPIVTVTNTGPRVILTLNQRRGGPGDPGPAGATTWAGITDKPATFDPSAHAASHATAGTDPISPSSIGALAASSNLSDLANAAAALGHLGGKTTGIAVFGAETVAAANAALAVQTTTSSDDAVANSADQVAIPGMSVTLEANAYYEMMFIGRVASVSTGCGIRLLFPNELSPDAAGTRVGNFITPNSVDVATMAASPRRITLAFQNASFSGTQYYISRIMFLNGATAQTATFSILQTGTPGGTSTIFAGAVARVTKLG
jgi:hypothetical protein